MRQVIKKEDYRIPVYSWCPNIENSAMTQVDNLARLPFAYKHIVLCPDVHMGYGMPIGGVMATKGVVLPNCVGVDVSCGVIAQETSIKNIGMAKVRTIMGDIRKAIPVGMKSHLVPQDGMPDTTMHDYETPIVMREWDKAKKSLGTLGGGNHFIEIQQDNQGVMWIMIHSGSRNLGKQVADHYNKIAKELNAKYFSEVEKGQDLAFLPLETWEAQTYLHEMEYCIAYAEANRNLMMERIREILRNNVAMVSFTNKTFVHVNHNYARMEHHFGENVLVHRKGATSAKEGELGIIPGSQGTKSYIVKGKGNRESFMSCSHGAGRAIGRKEAQRTLVLEDEIKRLDDQGIVHSIRNVNDLDEAAGAYKPIDEVMANQSDLVEIVTELSPLGCIKG